MPALPEKGSGLGRAFDAIAPELKPKVAALYRADLRYRWRSLLFLWLVIVPICLFLLRKVWGLLWDYFTWSALRLGLQYNLVPTMGIVAVLLLTATSVSRWLQIRWFGLPRSEVERFVNQAQKTPKPRRPGRDEPRSSG